MVYAAFLKWLITSPRDTLPLECLAISSSLDNGGVLSGVPFFGIRWIRKYSTDLSIADAYEN